MIFIPNKFLYQVSLFHQCYMGLGFVFTHCESSMTIVYDKIGIYRDWVECVDFKGLDHQKNGGWFICHWYVFMWGTVKWPVMWFWLSSGNWACLLGNVFRKMCQNPRYIARFFFPHLNGTAYYRYYEIFMTHRYF